LKSLAEAALAVLAHRGTTQYESKTPQGSEFKIRLTGPDLPTAIPETVVAPSQVPKDLQWRETYRLVVSPPLIVLDLCWKPGEPLRIMSFSRGDWETQLLEMAQSSKPRPPGQGPM
jgi:hypothetical protein